MEVWSLVKPPGKSETMKRCKPFIFVLPLPFGKGRSLIVEALSDLNFKENIENFKKKDLFWLMAKKPGKLSREKI